MKKISPEQKWWLVRYQRTLEKKKKNHAKVRTKKTRQKRKKSSSVIVEAPALMSLRSNYENVMAFIQRLRQIVTLRQGKKVWADFRTIKTLMPGAALVLAAELYRWQKIHNVSLVPRGINRWRANVRALFSELGLFSLLSTRRTNKYVKNPSETTFVRFISGVGTEGKAVRSLRNSIERVIGFPVNRGGMYTALTEAMANVSQHAYPPDHDLPYEALVGQWWMSGSYNRENSTFTVMIFDQGIGIPESLPTSGVGERIRAILKVFDSDAAMISAAIEYGRSATKEDHRGKGLRQIARFADADRRGEFHIISGKGYYSKNRLGQEKKVDYNAALGGTFIQWELPVGELKWQKI
ncbi:MAG: hypothetical protein HY794_17185 [Desulfarculus sp.]|nr:hypothetical protein [Desulfarculus sp.]